MIHNITYNLYTYVTLDPKGVSRFWSSVGFKIGVVTRFVSAIFVFVWPTGKYVLHVYAGTKFPIYKVWWPREASQTRQTFIPLCEKVAQYGRIQIDQAILAAIGHRFMIAKKKKF